MIINTPIPDHMKIVLILLSVVLLAIWLVRNIVRINRKNRIPVLTAPAVDHYRHPEIKSTTVRSAYGFRNKTTFYITLHTETGDILKLS